MIAHDEYSARLSHAAERFKRRLGDIYSEDAIGLAELFIASVEEILRDATAMSKKPNESEAVKKDWRIGLRHE